MIELSDFARRAEGLIREVVAGGESLLIQEKEQPVAILASHQSVLAMATMVDLPRWEEWVEEMRESFPAAADRLEKLSLRSADSEELIKSELGFDPAAGRVGSEDGLEFLRASLQRLGVPVVEEALLSSLYAAVLELCEEKETIYAEDVRALAQAAISDAPERLRLLSLTVQSSSGLPAMAEVTLEVGQGPAMRREQGDGPLDAAFKAIEKLTGLAPDVENFSVVAATRGRDATAEAMVRLNLDGSVVVGAGASTNAVEAGVRAYLNGLNFLLEARRAEVASAKDSSPGK